jgi:hypothetical protein
MLKKIRRARHATDDNITRRMRTEWWVTKATDTHLECVIIYCFSTATMAVRTRLNVTSYEQKAAKFVKAAKFAHNTNSPKWETLVSRRKLSRICALFKAYSGER